MASRGDKMPIWRGGRAASLGIRCCRSVLRRMASFQAEGTARRRRAHKDHGAVATSDGVEARPATSTPEPPGDSTRTDPRPQIRIFIEGMVLHHPEESDRSLPPTRAQACNIDCGAKIPQVGTFPSVRQGKAACSHDLCDALHPASPTGEY